MRDWKDAFMNKSDSVTVALMHGLSKMTLLTLCFLKKEKGKRERKMRQGRGTLLPTHHWQLSHGKRDGGMDEEIKTSIKRLMGQIHSKESHDKCPQLARMGQALTMKWSTYLPACALYNRENTAQINIHRSQSPPSLTAKHYWGKTCFWKSIHYC